MVDVRFGRNGIMDVVLEREELVLAIQQRAWLMAKSAAEKENYSEKQGKWMEDIFHGSDEDGSRIEVPERWMSLAFNTAASKFSHLALDVKGDRAYDERYEKKDVYVLIIKQPRNMNQYQGQLVADLMFEYVVLYTLWKWCNEISPEFAEIINAELQVADEQLKNIIKQYDTVGDRKLFPF